MATDYHYSQEFIAKLLFEAGFKITEEREPLAVESDEYGEYPYYLITEATLVQ